MRDVICDIIIIIGKLCIVETDPQHKGEQSFVLYDLCQWYILPLYAYTGPGHCYIRKYMFSNVPISSKHPVDRPSNISFQLNYLHLNYKGKNADWQMMLMIKSCTAFRNG